MTGGVLDRIPRDILERAIARLGEQFSPETVEYIRGLHAKYGGSWVHFMSVLKLPGGAEIPRGHLDFGMRVRNDLREQVGLDDVLPFEHGWEDCYVEIIEAAVGLRPLPSAEGGV